MSAHPSRNHAYIVLAVTLVITWPSRRVHDWLTVKSVRLMNNNKSCSRNYPHERVGQIFLSDPFTPRTHMKSEPPRPSGQLCEPDPPGHVSALINPCPTMNQICLDPQDKLPPHPPDRIGQRDLLPLRHVVNRTPSLRMTKKCLRPTHP